MNDKRKINKNKYMIFLVVLFAILIYCIYIICNLIIKPTDTFVVENGKLSSEETNIRVCYKR